MCCFTVKQDRLRDTGATVRRPSKAKHLAMESLRSSGVLASQRQPPQCVDQLHRLLGMCACVASPCLSQSSHQLSQSVWTRQRKSAPSSPHFQFTAFSCHLLKPISRLWLFNEPSDHSVGYWSDFLYAFSTRCMLMRSKLSVQHVHPCMALTLLILLLMLF